VGILKLLFRKPRQPRHLRTYEHVAQVDHQCDNCPGIIRPGDFYLGRVFVMSNGLYLYKEHVDPPCERPYHEDWDKVLERDVGSSIVEAVA
jgi:hypothetical protein